MGARPITPAAVGLAAFLFVLGVDLGTKVVAVLLDRDDGWLIYNGTASPGLPRRIAMSLLAVAVTAGLARLARWRGIGEIWGAWVGCGCLVAGILGNGLSSVIWSQGVPDFIHAGDRWVWNVADFAIGLGLGGGIASIALGALAVYVRELVTRPSAPATVAASSAPTSANPSRSTPA